MTGRKIGISPEDLRDIIDLAALAGRYNIAKRCAGGRLIADGYICGICGEDPTHVHEKNGRRFRKCGAPRSKNLSHKMTEEIMALLPMEG